MVSSEKLLVIFDHLIKLIQFILRVKMATRDLNLENFAYVVLGSNLTESILGA